MAHTVMPDRIEAGTFMVAAAITGGDVRLCNMRLEHLDALVFKLQDAGVEITNKDNVVRVRGPRKLRSRQHQDPALSRLSHRHAGPVHGPDVPVPRGPA